MKLDGRGNPLMASDLDLDLLRAVADYADTFHRAPSVGQLAFLIGSTKTQVVRSLAKLRRLGLNEW